MAILELNNVSIRFGGLIALNNVSLTVTQGSIHALIGPNGAGKSTLFNLITGIYRPSAGTISFKDMPIGGAPPFRIATAGIGRTFQNIRLFGDLTVLDNVLIGAHSRGKQNLTGALLGFTTRVRAEEGLLLDLARQSLATVGLSYRSFELAGNLPYGEQRRLEIARALSLQPDLLLLDEPAAGMNPQEKAELLTMVKRIRSSGITVFLVEHDMKFVMNISDLITVLDYGEKIAEGVPEQIRNNPSVIKAYLGGGSQC